MGPYIEWVGWGATFIFSLSYVFKSRRSLLLCQLCGAIAWLSYGVLKQAYPVMVANAIVAVGSTFSLWRGKDADRQAPVA